MANGSGLATSSLVVSLFALTISGFTLYKQISPNDHTKSTITHVEWQMKKGKFGFGPNLLLGVSFINSGNRPITLSKLIVSFGYNKQFKSAPSCLISDGLWTGVPWKEIFDGERSKTALPLTISASLATSAVYIFDSANVVPEQMLKKKMYSLRACLEYEVINSNGEISVIRSPLGVITISDKQIEDFVRDDTLMKPIVLVD